MVYEEIRERHEVLAPREENRQYGGYEQCPFQRSFYHKQAKHEKSHHESSHIDGTGSAWLLTPILSQLLINGKEFRISLAHGSLVLAQRHGGSTLGVGHQERPSLASSVTPLRYIVPVQSTVSLVGGIFLHQLTLAAHGLLAILPCMVEIAQVEANTYGGSRHTNGSGLAQVCPLLLADSVYHEGYHHQQNDKQIVVGHLHVVGLHLKGGENGSHYQPRPVFAPIGQHHTRYHGRQICQGHHLPQVTGGDDDEKITGESPNNRAQYGQ